MRYTDNVPAPPPTQIEQLEKRDKILAGIGYHMRSKQKELLAAWDKFDAVLYARKWMKSDIEYERLEFLRTQCAQHSAELEVLIMQHRRRIWQLRPQPRLLRSL